MNIHHVLSRVNAGDFDFFLKMTDDEVKELSPYVLALWLRGANDNRAEHTIMTNEFMNTKLFTLSKHPKLLYLLACYANSGMGNTRYSFIGDKKEGKPKRTKLVMREFQCTENSAKLYEKLLTEEDFKELEKKYEEVDK